MVMAENLARVAQGLWLPDSAATAEGSGNGLTAGKKNAERLGTRSRTTPHHGVALLGLKEGIFTGRWLTLGGFTMESMRMFGVASSLVLRCRRLS